MFTTFERSLQRLHASLDGAIVSLIQIIEVFAAPSNRYFLRMGGIISENAQQTVFTRPYVKTFYSCLFALCPYLVSLFLFHTYLNKSDNKKFIISDGTYFA